MYGFGAHNALSGYKPLKWYMKLINFTSKCQSKTVKELLKANCRYFDVRLLKHKGIYISAHGIVKYNISLSDFLKEVQEGIEEFNINENVYFRILHENTNGEHERFNTFADNIEEIIKNELRCDNLVLISIQSKLNWSLKREYCFMPIIGKNDYEFSKKGLQQKIEEIKNMPQCMYLTLAEMYISSPMKYFLLPFPKRSAKKLRDCVDKKLYNGVSVIDFI